MIKLLYFMGLVDVMGCAQEEVALSDAMHDVKGLVAWLEQRDEQCAKALAGGAGVQITINKRFVDLAAEVREEDEIAFFPVAR